jgi:hypothetical protein
MREEIRSAISNLISNGLESFTGSQVIKQITKKIKKDSKSKQLSVTEYDQIIEEFNWLVLNGFIMNDIGKSASKSNFYRLTQKGREDVF